MARHRIAGQLFQVRPEAFLIFQRRQAQHIAEDDHVRRRGSASPIQARHQGVTVLNHRPQRDAVLGGKLLPERLLRRKFAVAVYRQRILPGGQHSAKDQYQPEDTAYNHHYSSKVLLGSWWLLVLGNRFVLYHQQPITNNQQPTSKLQILPNREITSQQSQ